MTKNYDSVIGARISQELMDRVKETGLSNSEIIIKSLTYYLDCIVNKKKNHVNKEIFENKYQSLCKIIDEYLNTKKGGF